MMSPIEQSTAAPARRMVGLALMVGVQVATIAALHGLGRLSWMRVPWADVGTWLELAPLEDVVAAVLRTIALGIAYWIAASTAAYALARALRIPRAVAATAWATLPAVRRVIDRAIAVSATAAALSAPLAPALAADIGAATPDPVTYEISETGIPTPVDAPEASPTRVAPPGTEGAGYTPTPAGGVELGSEAGQIAEVHYEVVKGDNLWKISQRHLGHVIGDDVDAQQVSIYWRQVIELNQPNLRSGDPNLIYPGEQIVLPPIDIGGNT